MFIALVSSSQGVVVGDEFLGDSLLITQGAGSLLLLGVYSESPLCIRRIEPAPPPPSFLSSPLVDDFISD